MLFLVPFLGSILAVIAATLTIVATTMSWFTPFITAIGEFIVWYLKTFFEGIKAILQNLSTVSVIVLVVAAVWFHVRQQEQADCRAEVNKQRAYDSVQINNLKKQLANVDKESDQSQDASKAKPITKKKKVIISAPAKLIWPGDPS